MDKQSPPVVVHPLVEGTRLVKIHGRSAGKAHSLEDLERFLREAGLRDIDVDNSTVVEWRGGGSSMWPQRP
ncbi:hypothetical protein AB0K09_30985 [Streptomyces sp. NPDC049577]|uniref:hypothetical protein n=1 Tax=Streptomyces sp. NPDC049577 TaxID=3155153 RepID=UPI0034224A04